MVAGGPLTEKALAAAPGTGREWADLGLCETTPPSWPTPLHCPNPGPWWIFRPISARRSSPGYRLVGCLGSPGVTTVYPAASLQRRDSDLSAASHRLVVGPASPSTRPFTPEVAGSASRCPRSTSGPSLAILQKVFSAPTTRHAPLQDFLERMMGLEPTTFCMANASDRSHPFAPVRSNELFAGLSVQASERERTRANAEPCHPCHGSGADVGLGELPRTRTTPWRVVPRAAAVNHASAGPRLAPRPRSI
jgi:hypothetical protein